MDVSANHFNDSKAFIEYFNGMFNIYKNIEEYSSNKKPKKLIVFDCQYDWLIWLLICLIIKKLIQ